MAQNRKWGGFVSGTSSAAMCVVQSTHPEWFGHHPWITPAALCVFALSLLLYLSQMRWFQKSVLGISVATENQETAERGSSTASVNATVSPIISPVISPSITFATTPVMPPESLKELAKLISQEIPSSIAIEASQPVSIFAWRYNSEIFTVSNGVWRTGGKVGWTGISATISSVMPKKGMQGMTHPELVASVRVWTTEESKFVSVGRAYWIGKAENDIEIDAGETAKLVLLCFEVNAAKETYEWVAYSNPYVSEQLNSEWGPTSRELGERVAIPVASHPTLEVSIMDRYSRKVIDSRRLNITIREGIWSAEEVG